MGNLWISDISHYDKPDGSLPTGSGGRKIRFLGEIVSAASLLPPGEFQGGSIDCRRRPKRQRCPGKIRLGRSPETDEIHWSCTICKDQGVITNWKETRWDLSPELKKGRIVSLSEERARRAGRLVCSNEPQMVLELEVELLYAPVGLEEQVIRRVRITGDRTLQDLHGVIHKAFDRDEEEAFEFMFGAPYDPETRRFTGPSHELVDDDSPFLASGVRLDALGLCSGDTFGYLFDFSDEWVHRITVRSANEVSGRLLSPQVVHRIGESPPQLLATSEPWDEDLFWGDVETTYPLTGLYGPYLADEGVDPDEWLGLDDLERHLLVMEAHTHSLPSDHLQVESMILHAVVHVLAETTLAELGERKAKTKLRSYVESSPSRHHAIHKLGEDLVRMQLGTTPTPNHPKKARKKTRPKKIQLEE